ncbi:sulfotransferase domain-containing protein [Martelella alba]|uniref:Sulfotransferase domain-containing protein n=1 Tax=Martelella alba TaxID=2590451 RepID=A0A506U5A5_9HYPH|nr:sulfotransferase domain-containing protein [Martelella alba]TPW27107.1 sulfotransferase domain-containing protein [Martelella alba]
MSVVNSAGYILVNSLPKSGTHLLERALMVLGIENRESNRPLHRRLTDRLGLTSPSFIEHRSASRWSRVHFDGQNYVPDGLHTIPVGVFSPLYVSEDTMLRWLEPMAESSFIKGHLPFDPALDGLLKRRSVRAITILRDPRAVVASMVPYVLNAGNFKHGLQKTFASMSPEERIDFVIQGGVTGSGQSVISLADAFTSVLNWENSEHCLVVRFEDLVGMRGGGSAEAQNEALNAIAGHLGIEMSDQLRQKFDKIFDPSSPTFRGGKIDGWRERLTPGQSSRIVEAIGRELFTRAGYVVA